MDKHINNNSENSNYNDSGDNTTTKIKLQLNDSDIEDINEMIFMYENPEVMPPVPKLCRIKNILCVTDNHKLKLFAIFNSNLFFGKCKNIMEKYKESKKFIDLLFDEIQWGIINHPDNLINLEKLRKNICRAICDYSDNLETIKNIIEINEIIKSYEDFEYTEVMSHITYEYYFKISEKFNNANDCEDCCETIKFAEYAFYKNLLFLHGINENIENYWKKYEQLLNKLICDTNN